MDLLIIYSARKKGELLSLATLLYEKQIRFNPVELPENWSVSESEDLFFELKHNTHSIFIIDKADLNHNFFVFAAGFCLGSHEKSYFLDTEGSTFPDFWSNKFQITNSFADFIEKLWEEKIRWTRHLDRLEAKGAIIDRGLEASTSSFLDAVENGDSQSVELFLKAGFSPDTKSKKGVPVLCLAVRKSHFTILRVLLEAGANINLKSSDRDNTPLMDAAAEGNAEMVQELVEQGADLGGQSRNGQTALVLAVGKGDDFAAQILLEAGADPYIEDKLGMSAFKYAQLFGKTNLVELIEKIKPPLKS